MTARIPCKARSNDPDIRRALVQALLDHGIQRDAIKHELPLDTSSSGGRADMALALDYALVGIEIKSGKDCLDRLPTQFASYSAAFDHLILVHDDLHTDALRQRGGWHQRVVATGAAGAVVIQREGYCGLQGVLMEIRSTSYRSWRTSPFAMLHLLQASEVQRVAFALRISCDGRRCRAIPQIVEKATLAEIRTAVVGVMRRAVRNRWEEAFWRSFDAPSEIAA